ncbi:MAG TPA: pyruvate, phosphate dikinase, partial [Candidatus Sabulitectum sp.]|nr:pyruvate, phosphate dikinase [Candidatus Sabulitectum sp.]
EELLEIGQIIGRLNQALPHKKFVLIGPGRWGSKGDIKLGVHVGYSDINNTAMLIEVAKEKQGHVPDLSFGTHFFQDLVEADIKYMPLYPDDEGIIFREEAFLEAENHLTDLVKNAGKYAGVIRVVKVSDLLEGSTLSVILDSESEKGIAYLRTD